MSAAGFLDRSRIVAPPGWSRAPRAPTAAAAGFLAILSLASMLGR